MENLIDALNKKDYHFKYHFRNGYNHSFWYVASFIGEHIDFHAKYLNYHNL
jgi:S-formylglutathione hydrolase